MDVHRRPAQHSYDLRTGAVLALEIDPGKQHVRHNTPAARRSAQPHAHSFFFAVGAAAPGSAARRSARPYAHSYLSTSTGESAPARRAGTIVARNDSESGAPTTHTETPKAELTRRQAALVDGA